MGAIKGPFWEHCIVFSPLRVGSEPLQHQLQVTLVLVCWFNAWQEINEPTLKKENEKKQLWKHRLDELTNTDVESEHDKWADAKVQAITHAHSKGESRRIEEVRREKNRIYI